MTDKMIQDAIVARKATGQIPFALRKSIQGKLKKEKIQMGVNQFIDEQSRKLEEKA